MIPLLLLINGCTWELSNEPCDTGPEISQAQDPLWVSESAFWQEPAVGTGFVCGLSGTSTPI